MITKHICKLFGITYNKGTIAHIAMVEIIILAVLYFALIILRYATNIISHELFVELMIILGVGLIFDHYGVTVLTAGGCDTCQRERT